MIMPSWGVAGYILFGWIPAGMVALVLMRFAWRLTDEDELETRKRGYLAAWVFPFAAWLLLPVDLALYEKWWSAFPNVGLPGNYELRSPSQLVDRDTGQEITDQLELLQWRDPFLIGRMHHAKPYFLIDVGKRELIQFETEKELDAKAKALGIWLRLQPAGAAFETLRPDWVSAIGYAILWLPLVGLAWGTLRWVGRVADGS
ncbi:MAG: hypothetical protein IT162_02750 [Bryobacterales bacterium]|nr:hypothetical protein [Bryobacterales bacterium]